MNISQRSVLRKNEVIKESLRSILTQVNIHRPSQNSDILLLSTPRSGSTWLMEALSYEPGLRFVNEPLHAKYLTSGKLTAFLSNPRLFFNNTIFDIPSDLASAVDDYMLKPTNTKVCGQYNPLQKNFNFFSNRRIFKLINIGPVLDYFINYGLPSFYLIRHPIASLQSIINIKTGYPLQFRHYLENEAFQKKYLTLDQRTYLNTIDEKGSVHQKIAAKWALRQLPAWNMLKNNPNACPVVSYEQLVLEPEKSITFLANHLQLKKPELILKNMNIPSASTVNDRLKMVKDERSMLIRKWRQAITDEEEKRIFEVINRVGVGFYEKDRDQPTDLFWIS